MADAAAVPTGAVWAFMGAGDRAQTRGRRVAEALNRERWALLERVSRTLEPVMVALSAVWIALLVGELLNRGLPRTLDFFVWVIWAIFIADFAVKLLIAPERLTFLRRNWLTLISLFLPALLSLPLFRPWTQWSRSSILWLLALLFWVLGVALLNEGSEGGAVRWLRVTLYAWLYVSAISVVMQDRVLWNRLLGAVVLVCGLFAALSLVQALFIEERGWTFRAFRLASWGGHEMADFRNPIVSALYFGMLLLVALHLASRSAGVRPGARDWRFSKASSMRVRLSMGSSGGGDPRIQGLHQRFRQCGGAGRLECAALSVGDREHVLRPFPDRHDLRAVQFEVLFPEHLADLGQEARAVARDDFDDGAAVLRVRAEADLGRRREHPHLPRHAPRHGRRLRTPAGERRAQLALDARHAIAVLEFADKLSGERAHRGDPRIIDQPRIAGKLDQYVGQTLRQPRTARFLPLSSDEGLCLIKIIDVCGDRRAVADEDQRQQAPNETNRRRDSHERVLRH